MKNIILLAYLAFGTLLPSDVMSMIHLDEPRNESGATTTTMLRGGRGKELHIQTDEKKRGLQQGAAPSALSPVIISNGIVAIGVRPLGSLLADGGNPVSATDPGGYVETTRTVGLRYILPNSSEIEGVAWGGKIEDWGVNVDGDKAWSGLDYGDRDLTPVSFVANDTAATSSVEMNGGKLKI